MAANTKMKDDNTVQVRELIDQKKQKKSFANLVEKAIPFFLFIITSISIFTTIGIIFTLSTETIEFFKRVPILDFFTDRKSTRLNSSHVSISYAVFCFKKKNEHDSIHHINTQ